MKVKNPNNPAMAQFSMRIPQDVFDYYKATFPQYTQRMRDILVKEARTWMAHNARVEKNKREFEEFMEATKERVRKAQEEIAELEGAGCQHEYASETVGNCLTQYTCRTCGHSYEVDSSD